MQIGPAPFLGVELANADSGVGWATSTRAADEASGAMIGGVVDDTAAARAGIEAGDEITKVGGRTDHLRRRPRGRAGRVRRR